MSGRLYKFTNTFKDMFVPGKALVAMNLLYFLPKPLLYPLFPPSSCAEINFLQAAFHISGGSAWQEMSGQQVGLLNKWYKAVWLTPCIQ